MIKTRILILSDTRGMTMDGKLPHQSADVAIHCGDLTTESKLDEFRATLQLLRKIKAPLKLVIAGNHDFTLDEPIFRSKAEEAIAHSDRKLIVRTYGDYGQARQLFTDARENGIHFLDEGIHHISLANGSKLTVYASPYTPSLGDWEFQYHPDQGHHFDIPDGVDIAITHGPPRGILDRTDGRERAGCPDLSASVARSKPRIHCFGHIHEGWGAKVVAWREKLSENPSHLTDIDNDKSHVVELLSTLKRGRFDDDETAREKGEKARLYARQNYCGVSLGHDGEGQQTLFVNAAIEGRDMEGSLQLPWLVDLGLSKDPGAEELMSNNEMDN
ncbi:Metallo-dependent phosphatase [Cryphonectria parasitica EP155]|uniref:Metallo-dependent phosphatase n=1 Tax=Cryphonectria parasitica (strain ATCC 38755 / EP155) TaxID=660469 RepID=A0A9P5CLX7_CRYP1|nr:Metallo-dependent phosphatase [Cryphonectria parasitica EP155]KAF3762275.1 Metallo-dependent phosphatase [Cryphonectria parasitica EP155]